MANEIDDVTIWQGSACAVELRTEAEPTTPGGNGTPYTQSSFSAITLTLYQVYRGKWAVVSGYNDLALTISSVISNTLTGWAKDTRGYNFRYVIPAAAFTGRADYKAVFKFTLTNGEVYATLPVTIHVLASTDGGAIAGGGTSTTVTGELLYVATASAAIDNIGSESTLVGAGSGSMNIAGNSQAAGDTFYLRASGHYNTYSTADVEFIWRVKWGGTPDYTLTFTQTLLPSQSNQLWFLEVAFTRRVIGASGTMRASGCLKLPGQLTESYAKTTSDQTSSTVPSTAIALTGDWGTANEGNEMYCDQLELFKKRVSS